MVNLLFWSLIASLILQRLFELRLAQKNGRLALAAGANEFGARHYPFIVLFHILWFVCWIWESLESGPKLNSLWPYWLALLCLAQGLRYWAITSLGPYWNTRIFVIPGGLRIQKGPYRLLPHPNYIAVAVELICIPMIFGAWITALVASILNALLLLCFRLPAENRALQLLQH